MDLPTVMTLPHFVLQKKTWEQENLANVSFRWRWVDEMQSFYKCQNVLKWQSTPKTENSLGPIFWCIKSQILCFKLQNSQFLLCIFTWNKNFHSTLPWKFILDGYFFWSFKGADLEQKSGWGGSFPFFAPGHFRLFQIILQLLSECIYLYLEHCMWSKYNM